MIESKAESIKVYRIKPTQTEGAERKSRPDCKNSISDRMEKGKLKMRINGIGIIKKEEAMKILTTEGRKAVKSGDISMDELGAMYKLEMVKRASKIGRMNDTFNANYERVPEGIKDKLTPEEIAELVDAFYDCYSAGKAKG